MSFFKKSVSVLAVFAVIPAAVAVTARPSVTNVANAASRRLPTLTAYVNSQSGSVSDVIIEGSMSDTECVDAYTECMRSDDVCGMEFEECTTRKLFHGQMPKCLNVLSQCSGGGVADLFGTSSITSLGNIAMTDSKTGEILDYTYPTDGSAMGQWISAAAINNQYDTSTCVKRYTSCLQKDSVCGADFELCTSTREFKKQALLCDSTLARCQSTGVIEMLGVYPWTPSSATVGGRVATMIEDGAKLAAMNAVSTCYKVVEQCFLGACAANPLRCIEGSSLAAITAANLASETPEQTTDPDDRDGDGTNSRAEVNRFLKTACLDTIGSNKYCHMTFLEQTPTTSELRDPDLQEDVFQSAVDQRKKYVDSKIQDVMQKFDTRAKDKCAETIRTCAMRTCGEGIGSACYTSVFSADGQNTVNGTKTYNDIKRGCESIVNTDTNCQYAYATLKDDAYSYAYINNSVFDTLFPAYDETNKQDPIGVVASLNASLSNNYSMAAIADMKKQCQSIATSCVKTMCGADYINCYRNRTDIVSNLTDTGNASFDKSMNKVGGVLDYTVVLGLCMNTVKNADVCDEHLKITSARLKQGTELENAWGSSSTTRDGWVDAGGAKKITGVVDGVAKMDANGNKLCTNSAGEQGICYEVTANGDVYDDPGLISYESYLTEQSANTLFKELITDIEYEAQAKYNAKLTKQQNMCLAANENGGIMGTGDLGSTYAWVKLKNNKVPNNYATDGLKSSQIVNSNDLYGSFCRVRVTLQSDVPEIQDVLTKGADWSTRYFAAGDAYTCGSWIGQAHLDELAKAVATTARNKEDYAISKDGTNNWYWSLAAVLPAAGIGGAYLGDGIANGDVFGGLTGKKSTKTYKDLCLENITNVDNNLNASGWSAAKAYFDTAVRNVDDYNKGRESGKITLTTDAKWPESVAVVTSDPVDDAGNAAKPTYKCGATVVQEGTKCVGDMPLDIATNMVVDNLKSIEGVCNSLGVTECITKIAAVKINLTASNWGSASISYNQAYSVAKAAGGTNIKAWPTGVAYVVSDPVSTAPEKKYKCGDELVAATEKCVQITEGGTTKTVPMSKATNMVRQNLTSLRAVCNGMSDKESDRKKDNTTAQVVSSVLTTAIAGGLTVGIIETAKETRRDQAELDAYNAFYENLGQHINCYIGGSPAGNFGDVVATSLE